MSSVNRLLISIGLISAGVVLTASAPAFAREDLSPAGHTFISAEQQAFEAGIVAEGEAFETRVLAEQMSAVAGSQSQLDFERPEGLDGYTSPGEDGGSINFIDLGAVVNAIINWIMVNGDPDSNELPENCHVVSDGSTSCDPT